MDLSEMDLRESLPQLQELDFTDNVIWPEKDKLPEGFDPVKLLEENKTPTLGVKQLHQKGITGKNIGIAVIDQRLFLNHPDYKSNIVHYDDTGHEWDGFRKDNWHPDYHGSLVVGNAVGHSTGAAPGASIYYIASHNWSVKGEKLPPPQGNSEYVNTAIRKIIELNKTLPQDKKIRFLSCSWGTDKDLYVEERMRLYAEAEKDGIMVLGGAYDNARRNGIYYRPSDLKKPLPAVPEKYKNDSFFYVPTDGKTTPFYEGGFAYHVTGGASSTFPYLAGVFSLALETNPDFAKQNNWQQRMIDLAFQTATQTPNGRIINPPKLVKAISQENIRAASHPNSSKER